MTNWAQVGPVSQLIKAAPTVSVLASDGRGREGGIRGAARELGISRTGAWFIVSTSSPGKRARRSTTCRKSPAMGWSSMRSPACPRRSKPPWFAGRGGGFNHYEKSRCRLAADAASLNYRLKLRLQPVILGCRPFERIGDNFNSSKCGNAQRVAEGSCNGDTRRRKPTIRHSCDSVRFRGNNCNRWVSR